MIFTLTDTLGNHHQVAPVLTVDGTRTVCYNGDSYSPDEARRLAQALLDAASPIDAVSAG